MASADEQLELDEYSIDKIATLLTDIKPDEIGKSLGLDGADPFEVDDWAANFYNLFLSYPEIQGHVVMMLAPYILMVLTDKCKNDITLDDDTRLRFANAHAKLNEKFGNDIPDLLAVPEKTARITGLTNNLKAFLKSKINGVAEKPQYVYAETGVRGGSRSLWRLGENSRRAITPGSEKDFTKEERIFNDTGTGTRNFRQQIFNKIRKIANDWDSGNRITISIKYRTLSNILHNISAISNILQKHNIAQIPVSEKARLNRSWDNINTYIKTLKDNNIDVWSAAVDIIKMEEPANGDNSNDEIKIEDIAIGSPLFVNYIEAIKEASDKILNGPKIKGEFDTLNLPIKNTIEELYDMVKGAEQLWDITFLFIDDVEQVINDERVMVPKVVRCPVKDMQTYLYFPTESSYSKSDYYKSVLNVIDRYKSMKTVDSIRGKRTNLAKSAPVTGFIWAALPLLVAVGGTAVTAVSAAEGTCVGVVGQAVSVCVAPTIPTTLWKSSHAIFGAAAAAATTSRNSLRIMGKIFNQQDLNDADVENLWLNTFKALGDINELMVEPKEIAARASIMLESGIERALEDFRRNVRDVRENPDWLRKYEDAQGNIGEGKNKYCMLSMEDAAFFAQVQKAAADAVGMANQEARDKKCIQNAIQNFALKKLRLAINQLTADTKTDLREKLEAKQKKVNPTGLLNRAPLAEFNRDAAEKAEAALKAARAEINGELAGAAPKPARAAAAGQGADAAAAAAAAAAAEEEERRRQAAAAEEERRRKTAEAAAAEAEGARNAADRAAAAAVEAGEHKQQVEDGNALPVVVDAAAAEAAAAAERARLFAEDARKREEHAAAAAAAVASGLPLPPAPAGEPLHIQELRALVELGPTGQFRAERGRVGPNGEVLPNVNAHRPDQSPFAHGVGVLTKEERAAAALAKAAAENAKQKEEEAAAKAAEAAARAAASAARAAVTTTTSGRANPNQIAAAAAQAEEERVAAAAKAEEERLAALERAAAAARVIPPQPGQSYGAAAMATPEGRNEVAQGLAAARLAREAEAKSVPLIEKSKRYLNPIWWRVQDRQMVPLVADPPVPYDDVLDNSFIAYMKAGALPSTAAIGAMKRFAEWSGKPAEEYDSTDYKKPVPRLHVDIRILFTAADVSVINPAAGSRAPLMPKWKAELLRLLKQKQPPLKMTDIIDMTKIVYADNWKGSDKAADLIAISAEIGKYLAYRIKAGGGRKTRRFSGGKKTNKTRKVVQEEEDEGGDEDEEPKSALPGAMGFFAALQSHAERVTLAQQADLEAAKERGADALEAAQNAVILERAKADRRNFNRAAATLVTASNVAGGAVGLMAGAAVAAGGLAAGTVATAANTIGSLAPLLGAPDLGAKIKMALQLGGAAGGAVNNYAQAGYVDEAQKFIEGLQGEVVEMESAKHKLEKKRAKLVAKDEPTEEEIELMLSLKAEIKQKNKEIEAKIREKEKTQAALDRTKHELEGARLDGVNLYEALLKTKLPEARPPPAAAPRAAAAPAASRKKAANASNPRPEAPVAASAEPPRAKASSAAKSAYELPAKLADAEKLLAERIEKQGKLDESLSSATSIRVIASLREQLGDIAKHINALTAHVEELKAAAPAASAPAPAKGKAAAKGKAEPKMPATMGELIPAIIRFYPQGSEERKQIQVKIQACGRDLGKLQELYIKTRDEVNGVAAAPEAEAAPEAAPEADASDDEKEPFDVSKANLKTILEKLDEFNLVGDDEEKKKKVSDCKGKLLCLKKLFTDLATEKAEEAKVEYQGEPDSDDKKAAAIEAARAIGMTEESAEEWLQEPPAGGKRRTRKLPRRRSNRTRRQ